MSVVKRFARNTIAILISQAMEPVSSFVLVLLIARHLGANGLGIYATAFSLFFIFLTISSLGYSHLITREVARDKSKAGVYLVNASLVGLIFSLVMAVVMGIIAHLLYRTQIVVRSVWILGTALLPSILCLVCNSICRSLERMDYVSASTITADVFRMAVGFVILLKGYGLISLMIVIAGSYFVSMATSLYFVLKTIGRQSYRIDPAFCKWIVLTTPTFALIFIFATIYWNVDILMLSKMKGTAEVGFYTAGYKLMNMWKIIPLGYLMALQPLISQWFESSREKFRIACAKSINYLVILMTPIAFAITLFSKDLIRLLYKENFLPSAPALAILVWALIPYTINITLSYALVASNNQKINLYSLLASMVCNIFLNLILIRRYGFIGAAVATLVSICLFLGLQYGFVSRSLFRLNLWQIVAKPMIAGSIMGILVLVMRGSGVLFVVPLAIVVYALFLILLKTFSLEDWQLFRRLWQREKEVTPA